MNYKIGIFGSALGEKDGVGNLTIEKARLLGTVLGQQKITIITGACSGLPYVVASQAFKHGSEVYGYSPRIDIKGQKEFTPTDDMSIYKKIIYTPESFPFFQEDLVAKKYRNVISTTNCDGGIIIAGRWGTMNEFTNLYDMGKIIGVLTGTGGIADELVTLFPKITKKSKAKVIFDNNPENLIKKILQELNNKHLS